MEQGATVKVSADLSKELLDNLTELAAQRGVSANTVLQQMTVTQVGLPQQTPDEKKRGEIASLLVWSLVILVAVVAGCGLWLGAHACKDDATCKALMTSVDGFKTVVEIVLTPMVGLVGAVTGFYFGGKAAEQRR